MYLIDLPNEQYQAVVEVVRFADGEPTVVVTENIFERGDPRPHFANQGEWRFPSHEAAEAAVKEADAGLMTMNKIARVFQQHGGAEVA